MGFERSVVEQLPFVNFFKLIASFLFTTAFKNEVKAGLFSRTVLSK